LSQYFDADVRLTAETLLEVFFQNQDAETGPAAMEHASRAGSLMVATGVIAANGAAIFAQTWQRCTLPIVDCIALSGTKRPASRFGS